MSVKIVALAILILLLILIIELIRREKLTFRYAIGWLCAVFGGFILILAEKPVAELASFLGFELLSNFLFFCCMGIAVILGLFLTVLLCRQAHHNECLAKKIALMEDEMEELRSQK